MMNSAVLRFIKQYTIIHILLEYIILTLMFKLQINLIHHVRNDVFKYNVETC